MTAAPRPLPNLRSQPLRRLCPSAAAIAASVRALDDSRLAVAAVRNLEHFGVRTKHPALTTLLEAGEPGVRRAARKVLGMIDV